jgi:hypothetical protein
MVRWRYYQGVRVLEVVEVVQTGWDEMAEDERPNGIII